MKYLAVLGRQPEISIAEIESVLSKSFRLLFSSESYVVFSSDIESIDISRFGGVIKFAKELEKKPLDFLAGLPEGKLTLGVSDYSKKALRKTAATEALKLKKILVRHGRSVRVVENKEAILSTATSLHNGLNGKNERKVELIKIDENWYQVIGVQDIDAYAERDQARPARDAKVGMLPPKLAQILINLCGELKGGSTVLDPFCGTGVVLQEALLMGHRVYGTDISERMVEYSKRNLEWLVDNSKRLFSGPGPSLPSSRGSGPNSRQQPPKYPKNNLFELQNVTIPKSLEFDIFKTQQDHIIPKYPKNNLFELSQGDATTFTWRQPIDAVACEGYLGKPMSQIPVEIKLKTEKQECSTMILGFLKNLASQIKTGTPVVVACPAWLREDGKYSRLEILDEIENMGYNVNNKSREGLLYYREGQIVARDIIILRKN